MPLYEYYCSSCDGVFEQLRSIRESDEPYPCPECNREAPRIMPTSFMAFTMRDGYPRRIPDRGTYWHLGKEVKRPINVATPAGTHPDL
jgi:putative FmdB family regulatory protein